MSRRRLFCPEIAEGAIILSPEESHHAITVLRIQPCGEVVLFDGAGSEATAVVRDIQRRRLEVVVQEINVHPADLPHSLTLAVAMPKGPRQAYLIEKCTELGAAAIWPISTERSVADPKAGVVERWRRRAREATGQSQRKWIPRIEKPRTLDSSIAQVGVFDAAVFADLGPDAEGLAAYLGRRPDLNSLVAWVGPEGGWADAERRALAAAGADAVRLGPTVLRTETAAVAVCAAVALSCNTRDSVGRGAPT